MLKKILIKLIDDLIYTSRTNIQKYLYVTSILENKYSKHSIKLNTTCKWVKIHSKLIKSMENSLQIAIMKDNAKVSMLSIKAHKHKACNEIKPTYLSSSKSHCR